ncbi:hypothetical protein [Terrimonas ferruginea]|nr:hypothetical protein [Terrimonas ferruginea]
MTRNYYWYKPAQVRRLRIALSIIIVLIWAMLILLQRNNISLLWKELF